MVCDFYVPSLEVSVVITTDTTIIDVIVMINHFLFLNLSVNETGAPFNRANFVSSKPKNTKPSHHINKQSLIKLNNPYFFFWFSHIWA